MLRFLEGPSHFLGVETVTGAKAYFNLINEETGVNGRKLKPISADDGYDRAKTQPSFDHLMSEKVFALGFFVGTPTAVKYVPMAESAKIPLVVLFPGAQTLDTPLRHWIVNVRASYFDETREQVAGLWKTLGYKKIGVIYPEDAFGMRQDGPQGVRSRTCRHRLLSAANGTGWRSHQYCTRASPDAVVVVGWDPPIPWRRSSNKPRPRDGSRCF
jgi:branched-chain amino acid transport system substrate-binding protein